MMWAIKGASVWLRNCAKRRKKSRSSNRIKTTFLEQNNISHSSRLMEESLAAQLSIMMKPVVFMPTKLASKEDIWTTMEFQVMKWRKSLQVKPKHQGWKIRPRLCLLWATVDLDPWGHTSFTTSVRCLQDPSMRACTKKFQLETPLIVYRPANSQVN